MELFLSQDPNLIIISNRKIYIYNLFSVLHYNSSDIKLWKELAKELINYVLISGQRISRFMNSDYQRAKNFQIYSKSDGKLKQDINGDGSYR